ncbi:4Fe-4S dicluster domain-containing protein [Metapseudomonas boanensis]|uniref:4Fe-4S dicluster domain-containing protein n=1 Tax=Metapseudomonas boanensis TaxID=2822138 RepID=A0ABS5XL79_9GAMM|nr:4Fe-4S dicluster domain-containing protein [Pseudomonas boanensis]MBT8768464.1 4Fe-4S dicluster domain-containing protein [Pseudomonas boanensis]
MRAYSLERPELLRDHLARKSQVFELRASGPGVYAWQQVCDQDSHPFAPPVDPPGCSAKSFFFPERELLFRFDGGAFYSELPAVRPQVLFGLPACDLQAIAYQDRFFAADPYYQARREATLLVGVDCLHSCGHGSCSLFGCGPQAQAGTADLVLVPQQGMATSCLLVTSLAGARALCGLELETMESDWPHERALAGERVMYEQRNTDAIIEGIAAINAGWVKQSTWDELGQRCLNCTGCTSVCPTCSCFTAVDIPAASSGIGHLREWASCLDENFQREAGGRNPSASAGQRVQRFWFHKLGEAFRARMGGYGCVGCGRCDRHCPDGMGLMGVMHRLEQP